MAASVPDSWEDAIFAVEEVEVDKITTESSKSTLTMIISYREQRKLEIEPEFSRVRYIATLESGSNIS